MASTVVKFPALPTGLTLTCDVVSLSTLSVLEAGIALTEASAIYSGAVVGAIAGQVLFVLKSSGTVFGSRIRTIADTVGPFVILTELETLNDDGRGVYPVTITIDDGTDPVVGAFVRVTSAGVVASGTTDGSGVVKFALDNGTYDVAIAAAGYEAGIEALTVSGVSSDTYSLTELAITPPATLLVSTGTMVCYDESGVAEQNVSITIQLIAGAGVAGYGLDTKARTDTTDVDGYVEFPGMIRGATYSVRRGTAVAETALTVFATRSTGAATTCVVPNSDWFALPEVIGTDAE